MVVAPTGDAATFAQCFDSTTVIVDAHAFYVTGNRKNGGAGTPLRKIQWETDTAAYRDVETQRMGQSATWKNRRIHSDGKLTHQATQCHPHTCVNAASAKCKFSGVTDRLKEKRLTCMRACPCGTHSRHLLVTAVSMRSGTWALHVYPLCASPCKCCTKRAKKIRSDISPDPGGHRPHG